MLITCPHCQAETEHTPVDRINIDHEPALREKIQDLSCFRVKCPNCGETALVLQPCLYHDMENRFMVWLWPEEEPLPKADFEPTMGYALRVVDSLNSFREKINLLELGLDDRIVEIMKLMLLADLGRDMDVVELLFHEMDESGRNLRFVAVLSDGAEQYLSMPAAVYQSLRMDVETFLCLYPGEFARVDMDWACRGMERLQEMV